MSETPPVPESSSTQPLLPPSSSEMVAPSKELPQCNNNNTTAIENSYFPLIYGTFKRVTAVLACYFVGYMGWSVAWLIPPIILSCSQLRKDARQSRCIITGSKAGSSEKEIILSRITDLPSWVYFPDVERCEWINKILHQVWPNANDYAKDLVKTVIEPNIAQALAAYKLNGFKFDRLILGNIPPRIGGVKVYDKHVDRNEIVMDLDLFYTSDCDINFTLAGVRGGIKNFEIHGTVRVVMKPLISKIPLVGGLQIFFLNNPNIDFNLVGIADLLDMPGLNDMLRRIIVEQIGAIMVLPNKLPITLSDDVPAVTLKMPEPEGILRIHIVEAKDLMKKDISMLGKGKSDPYAIVTVGSQQFRTQTIDNTVNPKWDYWCEAEVNAVLGQEILLELWDWDPGFPGVENDDFLGRATVEISNAVKKGLLDTWLTLEDAKHGMVHIRLTWLTLSSTADDLQLALEETQLLRVTTMSTALLTVFLDSATNLPQARPQSKPDPYLILSVGKKSEQTAVQMRTDSPIWEQGYTFLVANPDNDTLQLRIVDQKTEKEIGRLTYILSALLQADNLCVNSQPFRLQKAGPESIVTMSLVLRIFKKSLNQDDDTISQQSSPTSLRRGDSAVGGLSRTSSVQSSRIADATAPGTVHAAQLQKQESKLSTHSSQFGGGNMDADSSGIAEEAFIESLVSAGSQLSASPSNSQRNSDNGSPAAANLIHRTPSVTSSAGTAGLGRIQLTLRYSIHRQRLIVIVHKIMNIPLKDPSNIPDPYVKLYLLPGRAKESKRKTNVVKDNCNPVYDTTFEYIISAAELQTSELEVTVATQKGFLSGGSPVIGMLKLYLNDPEISQQGSTYWHDLQPESDFE